MSTRILLSLLLAALIVAAPQVALAGSESDRQETDSEEQEVLVITNEDLERRFGPSEQGETDNESTPSPAEESKGEPGSGESAGGGEATGQGQPDKSLTPEQRAKRTAEIEKELVRLNKRLLSIRNPLLAGVHPATEEERAEQQGLGNAERLKQTKKKIADLEKELAKLRGQSK